MNKPPLLSICIPTLNRGKFIPETLDSIISQGQNDIEIIILDGGSIDNTTKVIKKYLEDYSFIKYIKLNKKNKKPHGYSFDEDVNMSISKSTGTYCWFFSDDDIVKPGAINTILNNLALSPDMLILNSEVMDKKMSKIIRPNSLKIEKDLIYKNNDFEKFVIRTADYLTYFGCVVIKKSIWDARNKVRYFGTFFAHVGVIFQKSFHNNILVIAQPLISIRYGNASWSETSFYYFLVVWPKLIWAFKNISDEAKIKICKKNFSKSLLTLLLYRARGSYSVKEYNKYFKDLFSPYSVIKYINYLIAIFPGHFLNTFLYIYFTIFSFLHSNSEFYLIDLKNSRFFYKNLF